MARRGTTYPPHQSLVKRRLANGLGFRKPPHRMSDEELDNLFEAYRDALAGSPRRRVVDAARLAASPAKRVAS